MGITVNAGNMPVFQRIRQGGLKSREEKMQRQQDRDNQIAVLEKQKAGLKNKECGSLDEIEDKLELLHSYEDQIKAVKHAFNSEQMHHILDEAREKGEKIAEELKKLAAKNEKERKEALLEEALGIEESQGMLSELMEELTEEVTEELSEKITEEMAEKLTEETAEEVTGELSEKIAEEMAEEVAGELSEEVTEEIAEKLAEETAEEAPGELSEKTAEEAAGKLPEKAAK